MDRLAPALRTALSRSPAPLRAVARAAGVDQSLLVRVVSGERRATPELCGRVMRALERWGTDCTAGASILRRALTRKGD
jgi:DNA-binding LacI/PurR family transcriptional regulator